MSVETVPVKLGDRTYDILIGGGLVARAGVEISSRLPGIRVAIVTDENVAGPHLAPLVASLRAERHRRRPKSFCRRVKRPRASMRCRRWSTAYWPPGWSAAMRSWRLAAA